jgi:hypothetical protein
VREFHKEHVAPTLNNNGANGSESVRPALFQNENRMVNCADRGGSAAVATPNPAELG